MSEDNARQNTEELPYDAPAPAWLPYTRTGDRGATHLGDHSRAGKSEPRVAAYGACGEASAALGLTVTLGTGLTSEMVMLLTRVQNDLVDVSADVGAPIAKDDSAHLRIDQQYITRLERASDHFNADLPLPAGFVVPGGTVTSALLHHAYAVTQRAERRVQAMIENQQKSTNPLTQTYLNRLANLLLVLARLANQEHGDTIWQPGLTSALDTDIWEPEYEESSES